MMQSLQKEKEPQKEPQTDPPKVTRQLNRAADAPQLASPHLLGEVAKTKAPTEAGLENLDEPENALLEEALQPEEDRKEEDLTFILGLDDITLLMEEGRFLPAFLKLTSQAPAHQKRTIALLDEEAGNTSLNTLLKSLSFEEKWQDYPTETLGILRLRDPEKNKESFFDLFPFEEKDAIEEKASKKKTEAKQAKKEKQLLKKSVKGVGATEAYEGLQILRALPDEIRQAIANEAPEIYEFALQHSHKQLNNSMRESEGMNLLSAGDKGKALEDDVLDILGDKAFWGLETSLGRLQSVFELALTLGRRKDLVGALQALEPSQIQAIYEDRQRREVITGLLGGKQEGSGVLDADAEGAAMAWASALPMSQDEISQDAKKIRYVKGGLSAVSLVTKANKRTRKAYREEKKAWRKAKKKAKKEGGDAGPKPERPHANIFAQLGKKGTKISNIHLEDGRAAFDELLSGLTGIDMVLASPEDQEEGFNTLDVAIDANRGTLDLASPILALESLRIPMGEAILETGPIFLEDLEVHATWPSRQDPLAKNLLALSLEHFMVENLTYSAPGTYFNIQSLELMGLQLEAKEMAHELEENGKLDYLVELLGMKQRLLNVLIQTLVGHFKDKFTPDILNELQDLEGQLMSSSGASRLGEVKLAFDSFALDGLSFGSQTYLEHFGLEDFSVLLTNQPSVRLQAQKEVLEKQKAAIEGSLLAGNDHEASGLSDSQREKLSQKVRVIEGQLSGIDEKALYYRDLEVLSQLYASYEKMLGFDLKGKHKKELDALKNDLSERAQNTGFQAQSGDALEGLQPFLEEKLHEGMAIVFYLERLTVQELSHGSDLHLGALDLESVSLSAEGLELGEDLPDGEASFYLHHAGIEDLNYQNSITLGSGGLDHMSASLESRGDHMKGSAAMDLAFQDLSVNNAEGKPLIEGLSGQSEDLSASFSASSLGADGKGGKTFRGELGLGELSLGEQKLPEEAQGVALSESELKGLRLGFESNPEEGSSFSLDLDALGSHLESQEESDIGLHGEAKILGLHAKLSGLEALQGLDDLPNLGQKSTYMDRPLALDFSLSAIQVPAFSFMSELLHLEGQSAGLSGLRVNTSLSLHDENDGQETSFKIQGLNLELDKVEANEAKLALPLPTGQALSLSLPNLLLEHLSLQDIALDGLSLSAIENMTGSFSLQKLSSHLEASFDKHLSAAVDFQLSMLKIEALQAGGLTFSLDELLLDALQAGPESGLGQGPVLSALGQLKQGSVRLGGLEVEGFDRKTWSGKTLVSLDEFKLSQMDYRSPQLSVKAKEAALKQVSMVMELDLLADKFAITEVQAPLVIGKGLLVERHGKTEGEKGQSESVDNVISLKSGALRGFKATSSNLLDPLSGRSKLQLESMKVDDLRFALAKDGQSLIDLNASLDLDSLIVNQVSDNIDFSLKSLDGEIAANGLGPGVELGSSNLGLEGLSGEVQGISSGSPLMAIVADRLFVQELNFTKGVDVANAKAMGEVFLKAHALSSAVLQSISITQDAESLRFHVGRGEAQVRDFGLLMNGIAPQTGKPKSQGQSDMPYDLAFTAEKPLRPHGALSLSDDRVGKLLGVEIQDGNMKFSLDSGVITRALALLPMFQPLLDGDAKDERSWWRVDQDISESLLRATANRVEKALGTMVADIPRSLGPWNNLDEAILRLLNMAPGANSGEAGFEGLFQSPIDAFLDEKVKPFLADLGGETLKYLLDELDSGEDKAASTGKAPSAESPSVLSEEKKGNVFENLWEDIKSLPEKGKELWNDVKDLPEKGAKKLLESKTAQDHLPGLFDDMGQYIAEGLTGRELLQGNPEADIATLADYFGGLEIDFDLKTEEGEFVGLRSPQSREDGQARAIEEFFRTKLSAWANLGGTLRQSQVDFGASLKDLIFMDNDFALGLSSLNMGAHADLELYSIIDGKGFNLSPEISNGGGWLSFTDLSFEVGKQDIAQNSPGAMTNLLESIKANTAKNKRLFEALTITGAAKAAVYRLLQ